MIRCSWQSTFGLDCPGCGAQRSLDLLFHGHFAEAIQLYPAIVPLMVAFSAISGYFITKRPIALNIFLVGFYAATVIMLQFCFRKFLLETQAGLIVVIVYYLIAAFILFRILHKFNSKTQVK